MSTLLNFTPFADDTTLACKDDNIEALAYKCNVVLDLLNKWFIRNGFTIKFDKTEFMIFSNRVHLVADSFISIGPSLIQNVKN